mmetsp:Transcript_23517/g.42042  ORF Transcript_23517/g.42042 Transcript_23517/m.42042 type:complete len:471 (-) Transcript_23517:82-1494(-)
MHVALARPASQLCLHRDLPGAEALPAPTGLAALAPLGPIGQQAVLRPGPWAAARLAHHAFAGLARPRGLSKRPAIAVRLDAMPRAALPLRPVVENAVMVGVFAGGIAEAFATCASDGQRPVAGLPSVARMLHHVSAVLLLPASAQLRAFAPGSPSRQLTVYLHVVRLAGNGLHLRAFAGVAQGAGGRGDLAHTGLLTLSIRAATPGRPLGEGADLISIAIADQARHGVSKTASAGLPAVVVKLGDLAGAVAQSVTGCWLLPLRPVCEGAVLGNAGGALERHILADGVIHLSPTAGSRFTSDIAHGVRDVLRLHLRLIEHSCTAHLATSPTGGGARAILPVCPDTPVGLLDRALVALGHLPGGRGLAELAQGVAQVPDVPDADLLAVAAVACTPLAPVVPDAVQHDAAAPRAAVRHLGAGAIARLAPELRRAQHAPLAHVLPAVAALGTLGPAGPGLQNAVHGLPKAAGLC